MTVSASGGQGKRGREMRRLTMPCNCCQISCAVKDARWSSGSTPMQAPAAEVLVPAEAAAPAEAAVPAEVLVPAGALVPATARVPEVVRG